MPVHKHSHFTTRQAWLVFFTVIGIEGCAACALYFRHGEHIAALLVATAWLRDSFWSVIEHSWYEA